MATTKVTKKLVLAAIWQLIDENAFVEIEGQIVTRADIESYLKTAIKQIDTKNEKARERAAQKKAEGDELTQKIVAILTDEFQTSTDILEKIKDESVTRPKVTARLTALVKSGQAHKTAVKTEDGRKLIAYAVGPDPETVEDEDE